MSQGLINGEMCELIHRREPNIISTPPGHEQTNAYTFTDIPLGRELPIFYGNSKAPGNNKIRIPQPITTAENKHK
ncbi:hypothetical protein J6590_028004 [Homalodisca vitripennis]|nr:hypothetical protein J6590_028004 [Homalodisca vitripennis]